MSQDPHYCAGFRFLPRKQGFPAHFPPSEVFYFHRIYSHPYALFRVPNVAPVLRRFRVPLGGGGIIGTRRPQNHPLRRGVAPRGDRRYSFAKVRQPHVGHIAPTSKTGEECRASSWHTLTLARFPQRGKCNGGAGRGNRKPAPPVRRGQIIAFPSFPTLRPPRRLFDPPCPCPPHIPAEHFRRLVRQGSNATPSPLPASHAASVWASVGSIGCSSARLRLEYAADTLTVGASPSSAKDAFVMLASSLRRKPVPAASL